MSSGELDALEAEFQRRRLARFDHAELLWLAALPEWPEEQAAALGFPLDAVCRRLAEAGLTERREVLTADGQVSATWWMPTSKRAAVGHYLRELLQPNEVREQVQKLATRLAGARDVPIPAATAAWIRVVVEHLDPPAGGRLISMVSDLLARESTVDALAVVHAAQALGDLLGEPMLSSARRARWRVDRGYREAVDARALTHFQPRPEVDDILAGLVTERNDTWAVHLLGDGGVGKTMTVRDLASGRFAQRQRIDPFPVARIDFDHLDPRYPHRRPGELVLALATELMGYTTSRQAQALFRSVDDEVAALHEHLAGSPVVDDDKLSRVIDAFVEYVNQLGDRVVLVLDTCEELAKLYAPGGRAPGIDRTFQLLEGIHQRTPRVCAVLAGRRLLTPDEDLSRGAGLELSERPYLQVIPIQGFKPDEAETYIHERDSSRTLSAPLRSAVIQRSRRPGSDLVNPFYLSRYCDWALDEPDLTPERLATGNEDPYIQQRIIDRVTNAAVRDCLPAAALLGRFDLAMIRPYLDRRNIDPDEAFSGLVGQEWVSAVTFDTEGRPRVIEVDDQLLPRLRAVVSARYPVDRMRLGHDLAALAATAPIEEFAIEVVEGVMRLLPLDEAAEVWAGLERRITEANAWGWASQVTPRIAALEMSLRPNRDQPTMIAAVLATQAAAILRLPDRPGLAPLWREVAALASLHPDPQTAVALEFRGLCGYVAATRHAEQSHVDNILSYWPQLAPEVRTGPMIAMLDALQDAVPSTLHEMLNLLCSMESELDVATTALLTRAIGRPHSDIQLAVEDIEAALRLAPAHSSHWTDWPAPKYPRHQARLARVVTAIRQGGQVEPRFAEWRDQAADFLTDIDAERLVSATITLELRWRLVDTKVVQSIGAKETYVSQRQPTHGWHHRIPTLCASIAVALAAGSDSPDDSIAALEHRREAAIMAGADPATISQCDITLTTLIRAYRVRRLSSSVFQLAQHDDEAQRELAWLTLALVDGRSPSPDEAGSWRTWWRAQIESADGGWWPIEVQQDVVGRVDEIEYRIATSADQSTWEDELDDVIGEMLASGAPDPDRPEDWVGALLRAVALLGRQRQDVDEFINRLPPRWVAETAYAEGEVLALRLPTHGRLLLARAGSLFERCDDQLGMTRTYSLLGKITESSPKLSTLKERAADADTAVYSSSRSELYLPWRQLVLALAVVAAVGVVTFQWLAWWIATIVIVVLLAGVAGLGWRRSSLRVSTRDTVAYRQTSWRYSVNPPEWERCAVSVFERTGGMVVSVEGFGKTPYPRFISASKGTVNEPRSTGSADGQRFLVTPIIVPAKNMSEPWENMLLPLEGNPLYIRFQPQKFDLRLSHWNLAISGGHVGNGPGMGATYIGPAHLRPPSQDLNRQVVHWIGTPVRTRAGWRLRVENTDYASSSSSYTQTGRSSFEGERLLGSDDLPFPVCLVVLQADPVDGPAQPLDRLRIGMCELAGEIRETGLSVLVVPPLPDHVAAQVTLMVSTVEATVRKVLDMVQDIKDLIAEHQQPDAKLKASNDVLLIVSEGRQQA